MLFHTWFVLPGVPDTERNFVEEAEYSVRRTIRAAGPTALWEVVMLNRRVAVSAVVFSIGVTACGDGGGRLLQGSSTEPIVMKPAAFARIGDIDSRYQSYNVEMLPAAER